MILMIFAFSSILKRWIQYDLRIISLKPENENFDLTFHNITFSDRTHIPNPQEIPQKFPRSLLQLPRTSAELPQKFGRPLAALRGAFWRGLSALSAAGVLRELRRT